MNLQGQNPCAPATNGNTANSGCAVAKSPKLSTKAGVVTGGTFASYVTNAAGEITAFTFSGTPTILTLQTTAEDAAAVIKSGFAYDPKTGTTDYSGKNTAEFKMNIMSDEAQLFYNSFKGGDNYGVFVTLGCDNYFIASTSGDCDGSPVEMLEVLSRSTEWSTKGSMVDLQFTANNRNIVALKINATYFDTTVTNWFVA